MSKPTEQNQSDLVVVVIGPSGAGKSKFIHNILSCDGVTYEGNLPQVSDESYDPCTSTTLPYIGTTKPNHWLARVVGVERVILVDTPCGHETDVGSSLSAVALFSTPTIKIALVVFMYPVTLGRMTGSCQEFLDQLQRLWGLETTKNLAIVTTQWSSFSPESADRRESELVNKIWKPIIERGACHYRAGDDNPKGASHLLQRVLMEQIQRSPPPDVTRLRAQIVRRLETDRGLRRAYDGLRKSISKESQDAPDGTARHRWLAMFQDFIDRLWPGR